MKDRFEVIHKEIRSAGPESATCLNVLTLLFELGAVFLLVQSILAVFPEGKSGWYLPLALGLNCIALLLNAIQRRKQQGKEKAKG